MSPLLNPYNSFGSLVAPTAVTIPATGSAFYPSVEQPPGWLDVGMWDSTVVFFDPNDTTTVTLTAHFSDNSKLPNTAIPVRLLRNTIGAPWVFRFRNYLPFVRFGLVQAAGIPVTVNMAVSLSNRPALYEQPYSAVGATLQLSSSRAMAGGATATDAVPHYMGPALFSLQPTVLAANPAWVLIQTHTGGNVLYRFDTLATEPNQSRLVWLPGEEIDIVVTNGATPQTVTYSLVAAS